MNNQEKRVGLIRRLSVVVLSCLILLVIGFLIYLGLDIDYKRECEVKEFSYDNNTLCFNEFGKECQYVCGGKCNTICGHLQVNCYQVSFQIQDCDEPKTVYYLYEEDFQEELEQLQSGFYPCYKDKKGSCTLFNNNNLGIGLAFAIMCIVILFLIAFCLLFLNH